MDYPQNLSFLASKLAGWSKNTVRVVPGTLQTATAGDIAIFTIPENTLANLDSLALCGSIAGIRNGNGIAVLPRNIESVLDMVTVEISGTSVDGSLIGYNHLAKLMNDFKRGNSQYTRTVLGLTQDNGTAGAGNLARIGFSSGTTANVGWASQPSTVVSDLAGNIDAYPFAITNWCGLLGCGKIIDSSILGTVRVIIRFAPSSIVMRHAGDANLPSYSLHDLKMYVDVCDVSDGIYYNSLQARLASSPLTIPFKRYLSFSGPTVTGSSAVRASVSTQSLDAIYCMLLPPTVARDARSASIDSATNLAQGADTYFVRKCTNVVSHQIDANSTLYPAFQANTSDCYYLLMNTFGLTANDIQEMSAYIDREKWKGEMSLFSYRWSHSPGLDGPLSGIDSRGLSLNLVWNIVASGSPNGQPLMIAETTAYLQVGAYRAISLIA